MLSYCCNANVIIPCSKEDSDKQIISDWYECSHCHRPCDRLKPYEPRTGEHE